MEILYGQDNIHTDVKDKFVSTVKYFELFQNYPNPFNPTTKIKYTVPIVGTQRAVSVRLKVYDLQGKEITTLINQQQAGGRYEIEFNAEKYNLSSGVYFYKLKAEGGEITRKMILLR